MQTGTTVLVCISIPYPRTGREFVSVQSNGICPGTVVQCHVQPGSKLPDNHSSQNSPDNSVEREA